MLATLGALDALVFTGGVGEHSAEVRSAACEAFGFLGLRLVRKRMPDHLKIPISPPAMPLWAS